VLSRTSVRFSSMTEDPGGSAAREKSSRESFLKEFLDHLTIPFVKPVAEGFFENTHQAESLVLMPHLMFGFLEVEDNIVNRIWSSVLDWPTTGHDYPAFLLECVTKLRAPMPSDSPQRIGERRDKMLENPTYGLALRTSMQVLYSAAISASWTALECLAADLWVASLNESPLPLAQTAITSLDQQEPGELTSKQIPVGLAARYGFDLRRCLGTLLKPKFDFTSVSGIQRAYRVFGTTDDYLTKAFAGSLLGELEATRHLIVHRASVVDADYKKRTDSPLPLGSRLTFTEEKAAAFARVSQGTGFSSASVRKRLVHRKIRISPRFHDRTDPQKLNPQLGAHRP
jgi:hypothetical protein